MNNTLMCSIVITTYDKPESLLLVLKSIFAQTVSFPYEVIVVKDGPSNETVSVCKSFNCKLIDSGNYHYRNPSRARNIGYRASQGDIIISQCDDVIHISDRVIENLVTRLKPYTFLLSKCESWVYDNNAPVKYIGDYCSLNKRPVPFFFCGAIKREDLYAVGGNDEDFVEVCYDDNWFADCLTKGLKLRPEYSTDILTHHIHHERITGSHKREYISKELYMAKVAEANRTGIWQSSGGPWIDT